MAYTGGKAKRVNTHTADNQSSPDITALKTGGWVIDWISEAQDGSSYGIYHQRFNANGKPVGNEIRTNTTTADNQIDPSIAALKGGGWVETWQSRNNAGENLYGIYQQAYNANGSKLGSETHVNTFPTLDQVEPDVIGLKAGGWVTVWQSDNQDHDGYGIYMQRFNANGTAAGTETRVNDFTTSDQFDADIAALDSGGFVVTWASHGHANDFTGIYQQVFDANGNEVGNEVHVNKHTTGQQFAPHVTNLENGGWVVTWQSQGQDGDGYGIYQQAYDADGSKNGGEKRVNTETANEQYAPDIAALPNGGWVTVWQSDGQDGSGSGIYMQVFKANGMRLGEEIRVNTRTQGDQVDPAVAVDTSGNIVVTWDSWGHDGAEGGIFQRVFSPGNAGNGAEGLILDLRPVIEGNGKDNTLEGKDIGEIFLGKGGDDTLIGKGGNDRMLGGRGDDLMVGGDGKDVFVFRTGDGTDTIRGFFDGDRIDLSKVDAIAGLDDLIYNHAHQVGADILLNGLGGDTIMIRHGLVGQLDETDFIFSL